MAFSGVLNFRDRGAFLVANLLVPISLVGCAMSASDFMELSERGQIETVCDVEPRVHSLADDLSASREKLREIEVALMEGYREHVECRQVSKGQTCKTWRVEGTDEFVSKCTDDFVTECDTIKTPIVFQSEMGRKRMLQERVSAREKEYEAAYKTCAANAKNMTVKERYALYEEYYY